MFPSKWKMFSFSQTDWRPCGYSPAMLGCQSLFSRDSTPVPSSVGGSRNSLRGSPWKHSKPVLGPEGPKYVRLSWGNGKIKSNSTKSLNGCYAKEILALLLFLSQNILTSKPRGAFHISRPFRPVKILNSKSWVNVPIPVNSPLPSVMVRSPGSPSSGPPPICVLPVSARTY